MPIEGVHWVNVDSEEFRILFHGDLLVVYLDIQASLLKVVNMVTDDLPGESSRSFFLNHCARIDRNSFNLETRSFSMGPDANTVQSSTYETSLKGGSGTGIELMY